METELKIVTVTPEMAQTWLTQNRYQYQRNVRPRQVAYLAEEMLRNKFKQETVIEFAIVNGNTWLTDGQHRLSAIVMSQIPQRFVILKKHAASEDSVAEDYIRTDQNILRTVAESYKTLGLEDEFGLTPTQLNYYGVAVAFVFQKFSGSLQKMHPDDRLRMMREYNEPFGDYLEAIAGCRREIRGRMERAATASVAIVTYRYSANVFSRDKVDEFWNGIAMDDGLRSGDPRKAVVRHLLEYNMSGSVRSGQKKTTSAAFSSRYIATCFNAFIVGKELNYAKPDQSQPMMIQGSPFNGKAG